jgi:hypothetical protein
MKFSCARSLLDSKEGLSTVKYKKHHCTHMSSGPLKQDNNSRTMVESQLVHMPLTPDGNMLQHAHFPVLEEPQLIHRYFLTNASINLI